MATPSQGLVHKCTCHFPMQDKLHGPQMRVHTPTTRSTKPGILTWRCTVCLKTVDVGI